ncbi:MAG: hypothetical protein IMW98_10475 [Firmicutes bacterium]|nr:hypothetical protein [Bacillota bacterium]
MIGTEPQRHRATARPRVEEAVQALPPATVLRYAWSFLRRHRGDAVALALFAAVAGLAAGYATLGGGASAPAALLPALAMPDGYALAVWEPRGLDAEGIRAAERDAHIAEAAVFVGAGVWTSHGFLDLLSASPELSKNLDASWTTGQAAWVPDGQACGAEGSDGAAGKAGGGATPLPGSIVIGGRVLPLTTRSFGCLPFLRAAVFLPAPGASGAAAPVPQLMLVRLRLPEARPDVRAALQRQFPEAIVFDPDFARRADADLERDAALSGAALAVVEAAVAVAAILLGVAFAFVAQLGHLSRFRAAGADWRAGAAVFAVEVALAAGAGLGLSAAGVAALSAAQPPVSGWGWRFLLLWVLVALAGAVLGRRWFRAAWPRF